MLRYLNPETAAVLRGCPPPQIGFNYLGRFTVSTTDIDAWNPLLAGVAGPGPHTPVGHPIDVNAVAEDDGTGVRLRAHWSWIPRLISGDSVRELADLWAEALAGIARHTRRPGAGGLTPTDVTEATVPQADLEELEAETPGLEDVLPLSVVDVFTYPTPRQLAGRLRAAGQDAADGRWLHRLVADDGQRIRRVVIGIPYGGGSATAYQALAAHLPPGTALWSAALPGHDPVRPEEPLVGWAQARDHLVEEIVRIQSAVHGVPVTLYGHCVGTGLTLAVARQLEDRGVPLASVYLGAALPLSQAREVGDDDELYAPRSGLGGFEGALDQEDIRRVLAVVRHDMAQGAELLREASAGGSRCVHRSV